MGNESEIIITTNEIQEGSPVEFLQRVRGIATSLRRLRGDDIPSQQDTPIERSATVLEDLQATLTSPSQHECTLQLQRLDTEDITTILYAGSSLFVQRRTDEEPEQMKPDAEGFGVIQFVNTVIDQLRKDADPDDIIW